MNIGARKSSFSLESRVQWSNTVGSVLWEGGARRCHPGFRPFGLVEMAAAVLQYPSDSNSVGQSRTPWSGCERAH